MKRLFPAIALMFVVALSSFTVISSSNNTKDEKKKAAFGTFYKYDYINSTWVVASPGDEEDTDICPTGTAKACVIDLISGDVTAAQNAALGVTSFPNGLPVTLTDYDTNTEDEEVIVYPRN